MGRTLDPARLGDHLDRLYRAAWALCGSREDAEDLVQETYTRVLARPRLLRNEDDLGYLLRALRNTFLNQKRTASRRLRPGPRPAQLDLVADRQALQPEAALEAHELYDDLIYVRLSGIGTGLILDGTPYRGHRGLRLVSRTPKRFDRHRHEQRCEFSYAARHAVRCVRSLTIALNLAAACGSRRRMSAVKASRASPTSSSRASTCAPITPRTFRSSACAQTAPKSPSLAPMTATVLFRSTLVAKGRETQSSAFLRAPGTEALYSGVANKTASDRAISRRSAATAGGTVSRSSLNAGMSASPRQTTNSTSEGSPAAAAFSSALLYEPLRRLPLIASR